MDFTNKINTNKSIKSKSPFSKGKLPTKSIRVRIPYYEKIRKYAFLRECPKSTIIDEIMKYGMRDYERQHKVNNPHK